MPCEKGQMVTCNRCDKFIFLRFLSRETTDGGFGTSYDVYEKLPKDWLYETEFGYLCPECALEFKKFVNKFFSGKVAYKWKLDVNLEESND